MTRIWQAKEAWKLTPLLDVNCKNVTLKITRPGMREKAVFDTNGQVAFQNGIKTIVTQGRTRTTQPTMWYVRAPQKSKNAP